MSAIDTVVALVIKFESCKLKATQISEFAWQIGFGHIEGVKSKDSISKQYALALLRQDANKSLDQALSISPKLRNATENQQAAITSFILNFGAENYSKSSIRRCVDAGDFNEAKHCLLKWSKRIINGELTEVPKLKRRRLAEAALLEVV